MVKGVYILKSHLDAIVCLSEVMVFGGENTATVASPTEQVIDQTQRDERVKYTVEDRLRMDGRMDWEMLKIEVSQGHVSLYGEVKTEEQKGLATLISRMVSGVVKVTNHIIVDEASSKHHLLQKALWNTLRDVEGLQMDTLHIRAKDGIVTLSGMAETEPQKAAAGKAAESVSGVKKVINVIHVGTLSFQTEQD